VPNNNKIIVIKLGALGDFFSSCETFSRIRSHHPHAHITLMTTSPFEGIAQQSPYFDDIWVIERFKSFELFGWLGIFKKLKREKFDFIYDLQRNDRAKIIGFAASLLAKTQVLSGQKKGRLDRLQDFKVPEGMLDTRDMSPFLTQDLSWLNGKTYSEFGIDQKYVLLVPGSAPQHPGKRWPATSYAKLADLLLHEGYQPVLIGTKADSDVTSLIKNAVPSAIDLTGTTKIEDVASLSRTATAAIGNDTGPMHIAAASGCPIVSLFSYISDPDQSAPRATSIEILRSQNIADISVENVFACFEKIKRENP